MTISDSITVSVKAVGDIVNLLPAKPVSATVALCRSVKIHMFSYLNLETANSPESFRCCEETTLLTINLTINNH